MSWFGHEGEALEGLLGLPHVVALRQVGSTMDSAHALAGEGGVAGTLVIAEEQHAGRGRGGKSWTSAPRAGLWCTLIERPRASDGLEVLSLRAGIALAARLERWTRSPIRLKWPNDLFVGDGKLAGVLIEARWRGANLDWVAIGVGINLELRRDPRPRTPPQSSLAIATPPRDVAALEGADALEVLAELVPALRAAAFATGPLRDDEVAAFAARDLARGRELTQPARGTARGISPTGELLVETDAGLITCRAGSLVLANA